MRDLTQRRVECNSNCHQVRPDSGVHFTPISCDLGSLSGPSSFSFSLLGGSRLVVSAMDTYVNVKLLLPPRQSRGVSQLTSSDRRRWRELRSVSAENGFCQADSVSQPVFKMSIQRRYDSAASARRTVGAGSRTSTICILTSDGFGDAGRR